MQQKNGFNDADAHLEGNRWIQAGDTLQRLCSSFVVTKLDKGGEEEGGREQTSHCPNYRYPRSG